MRFLYFDLLMISSSSTFFVRRVSLKYELSNVFQNLIPSLDHQSIKYKGQNGRILVIGGSRDYTGAPYYSGQSALKYGADLATILCSKDASLPIKSYSPELMVTPLYDDEKIYDNMTNEKEIKTSIRLLEERLPRAHSVVIGPGLGRAPIAPIISKAISLAIENNIPIVVDADGLHFVTMDLSLLKGYKKCVLTPNAVEFDRLVMAVIAHLELQIKEASSDTQQVESLLIGLRSTVIAERLHALSQYLGVLILRKGLQDMVCCGGDVYILREHGSPRRCGGQGDILAGILGVSMYWASLGNSSILSGGTYSPSSAGLLSSDSAQSWLEFEQSDLHAWRLPNYRGHSNNDPTSASKKQCVSSEVGPLQFELHVAAALFSAAIVRRAAVFAFTDKGRSVTSPDIIECIGRAFTDLVPDGTS